MSEFRVEWLTAGRTAQCPPDPRYPRGLDIDMSRKAERTCTVALPYPAPNCGAHVVICGKCGLKVAITAAGRTDDPRTAKLACKIQGSG